MAITHATVATAADDPDSELSSGEWNAAHTIGAGTIVNADISSSAEIAVSKLADGAAYQTLRTASDGTAVEWGYKLYVGTSAPGSPVTNDIWIDTTP
jgi:hypothetical protein